MRVTFSEAQQAARELQSISIVPMVDGALKKLFLEGGGVLKADSQPGKLPMPAKVLVRKLRDIPDVGGAQQKNVELIRKYLAPFLEKLPVQRGDREL